MQFDIDLSQVPSLKPLPAGIYLIRLVSWQQKESSTGNKKLVFESQVVAPDEIANHPDFSKFYFHMSLVDTALWRLRGMYEALGRLDEVANSGGFDPNDVIGDEVGVQVTQREFNDRILNDVSRFIPAHSVEPEVTGSIAAAEAGELDEGDEESVELPG